MSDERKALNEFKEIIERDDIESLLVKASERIQKSLGGKGLDGFDADLFEIIEEGVRSKLKKPMYIVDAKIGKDEKRGFAIQFENNEGETVDESAYHLEDGKVSAAMIRKIREMAYMEYELKQGRDAEIVEVFK